MEWDMGAFDTAEPKLVLHGSRVLSVACQNDPHACQDMG
jgi:hypothetical protein